MMRDMAVEPNCVLFRGIVIEKRMEVTMSPRFVNAGDRIFQSTYVCAYADESKRTKL